MLLRWSSPAIANLLLVLILLISASHLSFAQDEDVEEADAEDEEDGGDGDNNAKYSRYAGGYVPTTLVTDLAALDLDQKAFNDVLSDRKIKEAINIYTQGGHSGSYAVLTLTPVASSSTTTPTTATNATSTTTNATASNATTTNATTGISTTSRASTAIVLLAGTVVTGTATNNKTVVGIVKENVTIGGSSSDNTVEVAYEVLGRQEDYVNCQVGGLTAVQLANRKGCFAENGTVSMETADGATLQFEYKYDVRKENLNALTLQSVSRNFAQTMKSSDGGFMEELQVYVDYYGDADYADKWIMAAADGNATSFKSKRGNSDFKKHDGRPVRAEAMQRGSAYMTMWMEVVRQLNMAVGSCNSDQFQTAGEAIDAAAVLYTGSLTVVDGGKDAGVFQYGLAELHADLAKPVNHTSVDQNTSDAKLNIQVLKEFKAIQKAVSRNSKQCTEAEASRKKIINYMKIPLVQGVIYYAYQREKEIPMTDDARENMKYEELQSKGATFAAALLPWIHACNVEAAEAVHNNMQMGAPTYFQVVLDALTQNYECLGVDCVDIGGVWSGRDGDYKEGAFPCGVTAKERTNNGSAGFSIRGIASLVVTVAAAAFLSL